MQLKRKIFLLRAGFYFGLVVFIASCNSMGQTQSGKNYHRVAYDNCGVEGKQPHLVKGTSWRWRESELGLSVVSADDPARTVSYQDGDAVVYK